MTNTDALTDTKQMVGLAKRFARRFLNRSRFVTAVAAPALFQPDRPPKDNPDHRSTCPNAVKTDRPQIFAGVACKDELL
jgi:hypothetical protein